MGTMASQITRVSIVYSTVCSGTDQRKHKSSVSLAFVRGNSPGTGVFPAHRASNTENVSIWWRHHVIIHSKTRPHKHLWHHVLFISTYDSHHRWNIRIGKTICSWNTILIRLNNTCDDWCLIHFISRKMHIRHALLCFRLWLRSVTHFTSRDQL